MDAKIASLEEEIHGVKATLASMEKNQATLIAMFEKSLGKTIPTEEEVALLEGGSEKAIRGESAEKSGNNNTHRFSDETMTEFRQSVKKIELPMFDGKVPAGWISRAEVYFRVQETTPEVKINLAQLCMNGPTIHFFNSLLNESEDLTWNQLKEALLERYGGHGDGDVYEQLTELRQTGSVEEYITEFEYLTAQIPKLPDKQFLGYFLHGLKPEIKGKKETSKENGSGYYRQSKSGYGPNRPDAGGSARGSGAYWVLVKSNKDSSVIGSTRSSSIGPKTDLPAHSDKRRGTPRDKGFTHLSHSELMERKRKGLCFKCGGAYHPMHQCPDFQLRVLITEDEDEEGQEGKLLIVEVDEDDEETEGEISVLSFQQLAQNTLKPQTIKLKGTIQGVPVLILIDSGATHNFISYPLVHKMNWEIEETPPMNIKLGDGSCSKTKGSCVNLGVSIEDIPFRLNAHLFELGVVDMVLGMEWLQTLGDMIVNWNKLKFWRSNGVPDVPTFATTTFTTE
ncbi:hypothetical protein TSUD_137940 [Trifolium subterraneum]|uniref:Retrotransposon gag domain-containing protein n=1 Tax=Trifolium subterraneum TaxID=3900 RepID=A0A2Z6PF81_TRISU|nr:hypothetical protein TSUD_137940 [Trifolium subterraneum]